jgi:hypothetical protein
VVIKAGIVAFIGANGDGKTLCAVEELLLPAMRMGLPILSNVQLPTYKGAVLLQRWRQLEDFRPRKTEAGAGVVLLDDISALLPARQSMALPPELARTVNTLRKRGCQVGWTDPAWEGADTLLRRVTQQVVRCRGMRSDRWQRVAGRHQFPFRGRRVRVGGHAVPAVNGFGWSPKCLFRFEAYEARSFDQRLPSGVTGESAARRVKPLRSWWYWRPGHEGHRLYDTTAEVELMDWVSALGTCPVTVRESAALGVDDE